MSNAVVLKIGGEALTNPAALNDFLIAVKAVMQTRPVVVVHGGGPQVEELTAMTSLTTTKIDGVRATPNSHLPVISGALAGYASQQFLAACKAADLPAVGLSLADGQLFEAEQINQELGAVGKITPKNPQLLNCLLAEGFLVSMNSIACDNSGQTLNVNADDAAVAVAELIDAELCLLSNVPGVLDANKQLIPHLTRQSIDELITKGVITDGMVVKVNAAYQAANCLRRPVNIGSWQDSKNLMAMQNQTSIQLGTQIRL